MAQPMEIDATLDRDLHSRTIAALGEDVVRAITSSSVLISGMNGLGCEIAKNVLLGGVRSLTIQDTQPAALWDMSAHYFLTEVRLSCATRLASLLFHVCSILAAAWLCCEVYTHHAPTLHKAHTPHCP